MSEKVDLGKVKVWTKCRNDWYRLSTANGEQQWIAVQRMHEACAHIEALVAEVERLREKISLDAQCLGDYDSGDAKGLA